MLDNFVLCPSDPRLNAISLLLANDPKLLEFVLHKDRQKLAASSELLLECMRGYSCGQKLLIRIALDFWSGEGHAPLAEVIAKLDPLRFETFMLAMECLRYSR